MIRYGGRSLIHAHRLMIGGKFLILSTGGSRGNLIPHSPPYLTSVLESSPVLTVTLFVTLSGPLAFLAR